MDTTTAASVSATAPANGGGANSKRRNSTSDRLTPGPIYTHPVTFHYEIQSHNTRMQRLTNAFRVYRLMALTLVCVLAGIVIGLVCRPMARDWTERHFMYIEFPGELYLRFLRLMIIPLLVSNVILSFGTIQGKISSRLGKVASMLYLSSNVIAISVAIVCAVCIRPGGASRRLSDDNLGAPGEPISLAPGHSELSFSGQPAVQLALGQLGVGGSGGGNAREHQSFGQYLINHYRETLAARARGRPISASDQLEPDERYRTPLPVHRPHLMVQRRQLSERHRQQLEQERAHQQQVLLETSEHISLSTKLPIDVVLDVLRNLVPDSLVGATMQQSRTNLFTPKELRVDRNGSTEPPPNRWPIGHETIAQPNIIGLLAVSVLTGVVLSHMGEASKPLLDLCSCISELSLRVGMKAIHLAPLCIMCLLIGQVARARDLNSIAGELFMYSLTVSLALALHALLILPLIYYLVTKQSPLQFFKGMLEALVASFATSSSSSTMALTLNCLTSLNMNLVIVRAFGPLGSVFNMNGTSIFEAIAVIFIAQTLGVRLPLTSLLLVGLCSAVASLSTAGIPSSGMMTVVIVLNAINLPVLELSLIYIVEFMIDRLRTVVNVWSGAVVCGLINHICPEELFEEEMKPEKYREMVKYRASRGSLSGRKSSSAVDEKPQIISVTITPPDESSKI